MELVYFDSIPSTNVEAVEQGRLGAKDKTLFVANSQSAGKGRLDRHWESPAEKGLYFSLLLRPKMKAAQAPLVTLATGLSLAKSLRRLGLSNLLVKWPNDLLINKKKLGGILTEMYHRGTEVDFLVIGVGINVNSESKDFSPEIAPMTTSLLAASGKNWDRVELLNQLLPNLIEEIDCLVKNGPEDLLNSWEKESGMIGLSIHFTESGKKHSGVVLGLAKDGKLRVKTDTNQMMELLAEDSTLK